MPARDFRLALRFLGCERVAAPEQAQDAALSLPIEGFPFVEARWPVQDSAAYLRARTHVQPRGRRGHLGSWWVVGSAPSPVSTPSRWRMGASSTS